MTPPQRVVIAGAGVAGLRVAEELRRVGFAGQIAMIGDEPCQPYDRPSLSKRLLASELAPRPLARADLVADLGIELHLGAAVTGVDPAGRLVRLGDGAALPYDELVIASGMRARQLPGAPSGQFGNVYVLRSLADAVRLRAALRTAGSLLVVGAGFVGTEVAAAAAAAGLEVTVADPLSVPLQQSLGRLAGSQVAQIHRRAGVRLICGAGVARFEGRNDVTAARLSDGRRLEAELVLVGLGGVPATGYLQGSGVELRRGVSTDQFGRTSVPHIWAAGDVAESYRPRYGGSVQVEHWFNAHEQALTVAANILAGDGGLTAHDTVPYFWSEQHGTHLQVLGRPDSAVTPVRVDLTHPKPGTVYLYPGPGAELAAAVSLSAPAQLMRLRPLIAAGAGFGDAVSLLNSSGQAVRS